MAATDYTQLGGNYILAVGRSGEKLILGVASNGDGTGALLTASASGVGLLAAMPTPTANGAPLGAIPAGATAVEFFLQPASSVTFALATSQPGSPPTPTVVVNNATTSTTTFTLPLAGGVGVYITAQTGTVVYRYT